MKKKRKSSVQIEKWEEKVRVLLKHTNDTSTVIIKVTKKVTSRLSEYLIFIFNFFKETFFSLILNS